MNPLAEWQNFYVIVGSAAGGLTGLQFVVVALIADMPLGAEASEAGTAFSSPSILHFGTVLLLAAVLVMPWHAVAAAAIICGLAGFVGTMYTMVIAWRMSVQQAYKPVMEDWFFRVVLPTAGYISLATSAYLIRFVVRAALFGVASAALLLLFIGIHNAWDNVTYLVFVKKRELH
jgi:hypothetical protein